MYLTYSKQNTQMASFSTSTDDGNFHFQFTEPNIYISEDEQISGNKGEDSVYEEPNESSTR